MGSTLTHVRYYLDDQVHLLVKLNVVVITYAKEPLNKSHANTKRAITISSTTYSTTQCMFFTNFLYYFIFCLLFIFELIINHLICLTEIYKVTIACFIPTISVGSTLTHVRYYLDDPVHLLVSWTELWDSLTVPVTLLVQQYHSVVGATTRDY